MALRARSKAMVIPQAGTRMSFCGELQLDAIATVTGRIKALYEEIQAVGEQSTIRTINRLASYTDRLDDSSSVGSVFGPMRTELKRKKDTVAASPQRAG